MHYIELFIQCNDVHLEQFSQTCFFFFFFSDKNMYLTGNWLDLSRVSQLQNY